MSCRETCFDVWMEKRAAASCAAWFSLVHIALGTYAVTWCDTTTQAEPDLPQPRGDRELAQPAAHQHPSAKRLPSAQPTCVCLCCTIGRWTDAASLFIKDTDTHPSPLHHSGRGRKRRNVKANVFCVSWDLEIYVPLLDLTHLGNPSSPTLQTCGQMCPFARLPTI